MSSTSDPGPDRPQSDAPSSDAAGRLFRELEEAERLGDIDRELHLRVELSKELALSGDPRMVTHFEESLERVRHEQDRRREFILCINAVPALMKAGQTERALNVAREAVDLAGGSRQRVQALIVLGQVWKDGIGSSGQALEAWRGALDTLDRLGARSPESAGRLAAEIAGFLASIAQLALKKGDRELAARAASRIDPDLQLPDVPPASRDPERRSGEAPGSGTAHHVETVLRRWHGIDAAPEDGSTAELVEAMVEFASIWGWSDVAERLRAPAASSCERSEVQLSAALALTAQAERFARGQCDLAKAVVAVKGDPPAQDDLPCLCVYWLVANGFGQGPQAFALPEIAIELAEDGHDAARFARVAVSSRQLVNDLRGALRSAERGLARLGDGDPLLRVQLHNEASLFLVDLGAPEQALKHAQEAVQSAQAAGDAELMVVATVNQSRALEALGRVDEAYAVLERVLSETTLDAHAPPVEAARYNLEAYGILLGRARHAVEPSEDATADQLVLAAEHALRDNDLERGIALYERAVTAPNDQSFGAQMEMARRSVRLANLLRQTGRTGASARHARVAREVYARHGGGSGLVDATLALAQALGDDPDRMLQLADEAMQEASRIGDASRVADALVVQGLALHGQANIEAAIERLKSGLKNGTNDRRFAMLCLAALQNEAGHPLEGLALFEAVLADEQDDAAAMPMLLGAAEALTALGRRADALAKLEQACRIARSGVAETMIVEAFNRYGIALKEAGRLEQALDVLGEGLAHARATRPEADQIDLLINFANVLDELGQLTHAEDVLSRALRLARLAGDTEREGRITLGLANTAQSSGDSELARTRYLGAVSLGERTGDLDLQAGALDSLGTTYSIRGDAPRAVEYHRRAAELFRRAGSPYHETLALLQLAQSYLLLDEVALAEQALEGAKRASNRDDVKVPDEEFGQIAALIAAARGDWAAAEDLFDRALAEVERGRLAVGSPAQQRDWLAKRVAGYRLAVEAAVKAGQAEAAFSYLEWNRTRFLQAFARRRRERPEHVRPETWLRYRAAVDRLAEARGLDRIRLALDGDGSARALEAAEEEYARALSLLEAEGGAEAVLAHVAERPRPDALARQLPLGTVAVSCQTTNLGLTVIALWRDTETGEPRAKHTIDAGFTGADLDHLVFGDREAWDAARREGRRLEELPGEAFGWTIVSQTELRHRLWRKTVTRVSSELGTRLWPAITRVLPAHARTIVLLPGPGFNVLPIHAARLDGGVHAIDRYRLSYVPSLSLLGLFEDKGPLPSTPSVGLATNPTGDLFFSQFEGAEIAGRLPPGSATLHNGDQATAARVLDLLATRDIFHYAGHGAFAREDPLESRLFCAPSGAESGALTLSRILETLPSIRSRWVVLSACESGQVEANDRLQDELGLTGGFLAVGAELVIGTFWRVGDLPAALLLAKWYAETFRPYVRPLS